VRGVVHTNGLKNVWLLLKRSIIGAYHKVSRDYLPMYFAELAFRFNSRKQRNLFDMALQRAQGGQDEIICRELVCDGEFV
jgi:hypothetical protein